METGAKREVKSINSKFSSELNDRSVHVVFVVD